MKIYNIGGTRVTIIPPRITEAERSARLKQIEATIRALLLSHISGSAAGRRAAGHS